MLSAATDMQSVQQTSESLTEVPMPHHIRPKNVVMLPKDAKSPTGSIYQQFDIVKQTKTLVTYVGTKYVVYSNEPFTLRFQSKGKIREVSSKVRN